MFAAIGWYCMLLAAWLLVYKDSLGRLILALLDPPSKPTTGSNKNKYRSLGQLDIHIHDHPVRISSEPRSHVALRRERGPDIHKLLPASTRAHPFHQRLSTSFRDQSAQLSTFKYTSIRQSACIYALLAATRSNHRTRYLFLWTWLHTSQLHACFARCLNVTTSGLHCRHRLRKERLRPVRAWQAIRP
jgi:hypothetical protein